LTAYYLAYQCQWNIKKPAPTPGVGLLFVGILGRGILIQLTNEPLAEIKEFCFLLYMKVFDHHLHTIYSIETCEMIFLQKALMKSALAKQLNAF